MNAVTAVLTWDCPIGDKSERIRVFLTDEGYKQAMQSQERGEMKIVASSV